MAGEASGLANQNTDARWPWHLSSRIARPVTPL